MSYILDALKRAEAERERGAVPGLHSQQMARSAAVPTGGVRRTVGWWVSGSSLALVALAAVVWFWRVSVAPEPVAVPSRLPMAERTASGAELAPSEAAPGVPRVSATLQAPVTVPTVAPEAPKVDVKLASAQISTPASVSAPVPASAPVTAAVQRALPSASKAMAPVAPLPATPATQAAAPKVALLSELPEELRRQIPPLVITGVVYSDSPSQSLLLVNKLVLTQGNLAAPEVMLERIHLHHAVFSFRGTKFTLGY